MNKVFENLPLPPLPMEPRQYIVIVEFNLPYLLMFFIYITAAILVVLAVAVMVRYLNKPHG